MWCSTDSNDGSADISEQLSTRATHGFCMASFSARFTIEGFVEISYALIVMWCFVQW